MDADVDTDMDAGNRPPHVGAGEPHRASNPADQPNDAAIPRALREAVADHLTALLSPWFGPLLRHLGPRIDELVRRAASEGALDVAALAARDPAARGDWRLALDAYRCTHAVLGYRAAHAVQNILGGHGQTGPGHSIARQISEYVKVETGIEIHPAASIGPGFVLDHGSGTVIGETVVIGPHCYVLQGVVLGSRDIADNSDGKRHPTLGANVEVGAFARVLGPVGVGDDAVIGCHALVVDDVPPGARVSVLHEYQVVDDGSAAQVHSAEWSSPSELVIHGQGLDRIAAIEIGGVLVSEGRHAALGPQPDRITLTLPERERGRHRVRLILNDGTSTSLVIPPQRTSTPTASGTSHTRPKEITAS